MLIRQACLDDAEGIAKVHVEGWQTSYAGLLPAKFLEGLSVEQSAQTWRELLANPEEKTFVYVVEMAGGEIIGFIFGGPERDGNSTYRGEIYAIYLLTIWRHMGIGSHMLQMAASHLVENGVNSMLVWVLLGNASNAFYEALGGQRVGEKDILIGEGTYRVLAYGWPDLHALATDAE